MHNTRIALLGCNTLIREGLRRILEEKEFEVVLSSDKPACLLDLATGEGHQPLIVLVDRSSSEYEQDDIRAILDRMPHAKLAYLNEEFDLHDMLDAFELGIQGYMMRNIRCESLIGSLKLIALGEKILPGKLIDQLSSGQHLNGTAASAASNFHKILSARELEILRHLVDGLPNKSIARRLDLSEATVKIHVKGIFRKLNVNNRTQAAILALNSGLGLTSQDQPPDEDSAIPSEDARPAVRHPDGLGHLAVAD